MEQSLELIAKLSPEEFKQVCQRLEGQITKDTALEILGVHREQNKLHSVSIKTITEFNSKVLLLLFGVTREATFEELVKQAWFTLPESIRRLPDLPEIQITDIATEEQRGRPFNKDEVVLGMFVGIPKGAPHRFIRESNIIFVYEQHVRKLHEASGRSLEALLKSTIWHEVAHYLGHSEADMEKLGLKL